ncbi:MAG: ATP-binding protein [Burkholderiales bacterium]
MMRIIILVCVALGVALIALMFRASGNNTVFEQHYQSLFWVGLGLTIGLACLVSFQVYSLVRRVRAREFGSQLALRLMAVFVLMAIIPGGLVYAISVQFLNRSIDSWFDVPVDQAFKSALSLGRAALDANAVELLRRSRDAAIRAADAKGDAITVARQIRFLYNFDEVSVVGEDAVVRAWVGGDAEVPNNRNRLIPEKPSVDELRDAAQMGPQKFSETLGERAIYSRVVILVPAAPGIDGTRFLQIVQSAPKQIITDAQSIETGVRDYERLQLLRDGLKRVFALTLTVAMVLTLTSAISLSFLLSERLSAPLSALAESTRAIAKGDFTKLNPVKSRDEFGVLTQSFNMMTRQLSEASDNVARKQQELQTTNAYLESILGNLTSGVVTLDHDLNARSVNRVAREMLGVDAALIAGYPFKDWGKQRPYLSDLIEEIRGELQRSRADSSAKSKPWEKQFTIDSTDNLAAPSGNTVQMRATTKKTVLVRGTQLSEQAGGEGAGFVLVFDDITRLIQAQRDAAWGEVARRLAHEIKNPLTPIQLSAERMAMKLADKLPTAEREMLQRSTHTIVAQVAALKGMVDDFSLYSRASRMELGPVDINEVVSDVLALYESIPVQMNIELGKDLPTVSADPALLRQVIHNLMQNAQDALQASVSPTISIRTCLQGNDIELRVEDNGTGIRDDVLNRIFEPYVTTKARGTGLGLPIVKKIIDEHRGSVEAENLSPSGAAITIRLPIANPSLFAQQHASNASNQTS